MKNLPVYKVLEERVKTYPNKNFLIQENNHVTFKQLHEKSDRLATSFLKLGMKKGDKIGIIGLNQVEWLYTYFAVAKIGAILVTLNVRYRGEELEYMVNHSDMKMLVCISELGKFNYVDYLKEFKKRIPLVEHISYIGKEGSFNELLKTEVDEISLNDAKSKITKEDHLLMLYTSGTVGRPKGVMITNQSILASGQAQVDHFEVTEHDSAIGALPFNHVGGITCTMTVALLSASKVYLVPSFHPQTVIEIIQAKKPTIIGGVPTMYNMVFASIKSDEIDTSNIRLCIVGGSNVEQSVYSSIEEYFPQASIVNLFGLSETSGACILSRLTDDISLARQSIGVAIGDFEMKVVNPEGEEVPHGETGELLVKGDCLADGYYNAKEETDNAFRADWLYTGDVVSKNDEGYFFYLAREKELYISGGFNIAPTEIENLLTSHDNVQMAAGIGVPDEKMGEAGVYYIITTEQGKITSEELLKYCQENLADYKIPREFIFVDELPMTPAGKIQKSILKEEYLNEIK